MTALLKYWPLLAAVLAGAVAWGGQQVQIQSLEDAVKAQTKIQERQSDIRAEQARLSEQNEAIQRGIERQDRMLQMLLERTQ